MSVRITQEVLESLLRGNPNLRLTQEVIEAILSDTVIPAKLRVSQDVVEVLIASVVVPPVTGRKYGPRLQAV